MTDKSSSNGEEEKTKKSQEESQNVAEEKDKEINEKSDEKGNDIRGKRYKLLPNKKKKYPRHAFSTKDKSPILKHRFERLHAKRENAPHLAENKKIKDNETREKDIKIIQKKLANLRTAEKSPEKITENDTRENNRETHQMEKTQSPENGLSKQKKEEINSILSNKPSVQALQNFLKQRVQAETSEIRPKIVSPAQESSAENSSNNQPNKEKNSAESSIERTKSKPEEVEQAGEETKIQSKEESTVPTNQSSGQNSNRTLEKLLEMFPRVPSDDSLNGSMKESLEGLTDDSTTVYKGSSSDNQAKGKLDDNTGENPQPKNKSGNKAEMELNQDSINQNHYMNSEDPSVIILEDHLGSSSEIHNSDETEHLNCVRFYNYYDRRNERTRHLHLKNLKIRPKVFGVDPKELKNNPKFKWALQQNISNKTYGATPEKQEREAHNKLYYKNFRDSHSFPIRSPKVYYWYCESTRNMPNLSKLSQEQLRSYTNLNEAIKENDRYMSLLNEFKNKLQKTEETHRTKDLHVRTVHSVGQMVGEIITKMSDEKFIVKSSQGPRYVVGARKSLDRNKLVAGARVALDITTMTIMKILNREIDPTIFAMAEENPGDVDFSSIGGLGDQVRQLKEIITLPLDTPEIFSRVGIMEPKGVLLYGPPGTGKTLLARAIAATMDVTFLKVVASSLIEKYIGESSRMIREMFAYARERTPCIIFLDEIDAIGSKRSSESSSSDREVQRTLMELLNQLDGFHTLDQVKVIMATNRPDILDPALLRPGRLDRKIEIPLPNDNGRKEILQIYTKTMNKDGEIDFDVLVSLSNGLNGADLRHVCTEAGMTAIRDERDFVRMDDFVKAVRKVADVKKLETKLDYKKP